MLVWTWRTGGLCHESRGLTARSYELPTELTELCDEDADHSESDVVEVEESSDSWEEASDQIEVREEADAIGASGWR